MKTSNEWISDIYDKADQRLAQRKKSRKIMAGIASLTVCAAVLVCSVLAVPGLLDEHRPAAVDPKIPGASQAPAPAQPSGSHSTENPSDNSPGKKLWALNTIVGQSAGAPKYYAPSEHHQEIWSKAQITAYFGADFTALSPCASAGLTCSQRSEFRMLLHNDGEMVFDHQAFIYTGGNGRKVNVLVSKIAPPYDCIYQLGGDSKTLVGSTEVLCGVQAGSEEAPIFQFAYADFAAGGLYYRVTAHNLTPLELYEIVKGITDLK